MGARLEKLKTNLQENVAVKHVKNNKKEYIIAVVAATAGGLAVYFLAGNGQSTVTNTVNAGDIGGDLTVAGRDVINHHYAPKRLSYIVTDGERWWDTQASAAKDLGETATNVSRHINEGTPLKSGAKLERKGVRS